jgi:hypothetical protein
MTERTATPGQGGSTVGKPSTSDRYQDFTDEQLDAAGRWLANQGQEPWSTRLRLEGDYVVGDFCGAPAVVRQMVRELLDAIRLMTRDQVDLYLKSDTRGRVDLVEHVLTEAGR